MFNKKYQQKKKSKSSVGISAIIFLIICSIVGGYIFSQYKMGASRNGQQEYNNSWSLVLVNKWNPISSKNTIKTTTLLNGERVDTRIYPYLKKMFDSARKDGVYPIVSSGYRTAKEQKDIYNAKIQEYIAKGFSVSKAKTETEYWVAIPGTSEHELGLGIDINADGIHSKETEVYEWLKENAHLYGFITRYTAEKVDITGVANEPWHYRYVGIEAATDIYNQGLCLEEYLEQTN